eukprot:snap_masked-scaffold_31-processed-gene-3.53-mRNA-1 protein AED:0.46 eAED:0.46 QI:0/0/0/0.5/1/1/2/0/847
MKFSRKRNIKFILFGDSLTQRSFEEGGWGQLLADHYCRKADFINRGLSGWNTKWALQYISDMLKEIRVALNHYDHVILTIWFGANDAVCLHSGSKQFVPVGKFENNLKNMLLQIEKLACELGRELNVILISPPPVNEEQTMEDKFNKYGENAPLTPVRQTQNTKKYANAVSSVSSYLKNRNNLYIKSFFLDIFNKFFQMEDWKYKCFNDGLHFNKTGQKIVFEALLFLIEKNIPYISYSETPNHLPYHDEMSFFGYCDTACQETEQVIGYKAGYVWDWAVNNFEKKTFFVSKGKFVSPPVNLKNVQWVNLQDKIVLPGLMDGHLHVAMLGESTFNVDLTSCRGTKDILHLLREYIDEKKCPEERGIIVGFGWDHEQFEDETDFPEKQALDTLGCEKPIILFRVCAHIAILNSRAIEVCGFNDDTKVSGGEFNFETGLVKEMAATKVFSVLDEYSFKSSADSFSYKLKCVKKGLEICKAAGLTAVNTNDEGFYPIYQHLEREGELDIRVNLVSGYKELDRMVEEKRVMNQGESSVLRNERIKIFADGSLGAESAALFKNNSLTEFAGILIHSNNELKAIIKKAKNNNIQVEVHCIGDAAVDQVLKTYESIYGADIDLSQQEIYEQHRPQLTHIQILNKNIIERMEKCGTGLICNIQGSFVPTDASWIDKRIKDKERQKLCYSWKTLLHRGITLTGSSDAPVESITPLKGMYDLIFRHNSHDTWFGKGEKESVFLPEECLCFSEALAMYTTNAAYGSFSEDSLGRIEPGFCADFVCLVSTEGELPNLKKNPAFLRSLKVWASAIGGTYSVLDSNTCREFANPHLPGKNGPRLANSAKLRAGTAIYRSCC